MSEHNAFIWEMALFFIQKLRFEGYEDEKNIVSLLVFL